MSSKPGRTRKAPNQDPTSLAIPVPIKNVMSIDLQLLALNKSDILLDCIVVNYTSSTSASLKSKQIDRISKAFTDNYKPIDKPTLQNK